MSFTVVVPFRDGHATLPRLLDSLPVDQQVLVVDDQSQTPYQSERPNVRVLRLPARGYFAGAVNAGMAATTGDVLVLNQDVWLLGDRWREFTNQVDGVAIAGDGVLNHPAWPNGYVQGTFMYLARQAWEQVGPFNERDFPLWGCTAEWQLRACRAGFTARPGQVVGLQHERRRQYGAAITRALKDEPQKQSLFIRTPPLVSVIIPCYNYGRYLLDAVNSLVGGPTCLGEVPPQTWQAFEVIIVDDASEDDSAAIARALADPWRGVHCHLLSENVGTPGAINAGIERAHGRYVTVLSADDMMQPDRLERLWRAAEEHPDRVICDDLRVLVNGQLGERWGLPDYDPVSLPFKNSMHAGIFYPRAWWQEVGGYPTAMKYGREDWAFNLALAHYGHHGYMLNYAGYIYRRHGKNRSERNRGAEWRERFLEQLNALYPGLYNGEDDLMCCGKRAPTATTTTRSAMKTTALPGAQGLILLEYTGANTALVSWWGPTGTRYETSGAKRKFYVDQADADFFLSYREAGQSVFKKSMPKADGGVTPDLAQAVNPPAVAPEPVGAPVEEVGTFTVKTTDGIDDTEAVRVAAALAQRGREKRPRRKKAVADATI